MRWTTYNGKDDAHKGSNGAHDQRPVQARVESLVRRIVAVGDGHILVACAKPGLPDAVEPGQKRAKDHASHAPSAKIFRVEARLQQAVCRGGRPLLFVQASDEGAVAEAEHEEQGRPQGHLYAAHVGRHARNLGALVGGAAAVQMGALAHELKGRVVNVRPADRGLRAHAPGRLLGFVAVAAEGAGAGGGGVDAVEGGGGEVHERRGAADGG